MDVISWTGCALQAEFTPWEFVGTMRMELQRLEAERSGADIVRIPAADGSVIEYTYDDLAAQLSDIAAAAAECVECFGSDDAVSRCYRFIDFPIDAITERMIFNYFTRELSVERSP